MADPCAPHSGGVYTAGYSPLPTTIGGQGGNAPVAMPNPPALGATAPQSNTVSITDGTFVPETTRVSPGTTVKWVNNGQKNHTVTATDGSWDSGTIAPGQSYVRDFKNAGTFSYKCSLHPQKMEGKVIVEQTGTAPRAPGE